MKQDMFHMKGNISSDMLGSVFLGDFDDHLDGYTLFEQLHTCQGVGFI